MSKILRRKIQNISKDIEESVSGTGTSGRVRKPVDPESLIPSPSVPFNLECSGTIHGAFQKGKIVNIIGDSHAGKTLFALSIFAECSLVERLNDYRFILDDVECANEFDIGWLFGESCADRIEDDVHSTTIEEFEDNLTNALTDERPCIYVLDSADALTSEAAQKLDEENKIAREKGNKTSGSYGDGKAKVFSGLFSRKKDAIYNHKSLLIIISQTRDNIGFGAQFNPKVRSGGKALKFYSAHEVWLAMLKKEKKGDRTYSTDVQAKITKNKLTGRHGTAYFPILFDFGVDNLSSCIYFLLNEKHWSGNKTSVDTKGWHPEGKVSYQKLISYIEKGDHEERLFEECKAAYDAAIEKLIPSHRKRRY